MSAIVSGKVLKLVVWAEIPAGLPEAQIAVWALANMTTTLAFANSVRSVDVTVVPAAELAAAQLAGQGPRLHQ